MCDEVRVDLAFKALFRRLKAGEQNAGHPRTLASPLASTDQDGSHHSPIREADVGRVVCLLDPRYTFWTVAGADTSLRRFRR